MRCGDLEATDENYRYLAEKTGGIMLPIGEIDSLVDKIIAVAGSATAKLDDVKKLFKERNGGALTCDYAKLLEDLRAA